MSTIEIRAESGQVKQASAALDELQRAGTQAAGAADAVQQASADLAGTLRSVSAQVAEAAARQKVYTAEKDKATAASRRFNTELNDSRAALQSFIVEQLRANRSISENGEVLTAAGTVASRSTAQYQELTRVFLNLQNTSDNVADVMGRVNSQTTRNLSAAAQAAAAEDEYQDELRQTAALLENQIKVQQRNAAVRAAFSSQTGTAAAKAGEFGRKAAQAGIQVEQLVTGIAAGMNPMQQFAFQAADLGIVLGLPLLGSVVAVTAALAGPFIMSAFDGADASETLADSIQRVHEVATLGKGGVIEYTDEIREMANVSEEVARGRIRAAMEEAHRAVKSAAEAIRDTLDDAFSPGTGFFGVDIVNLKDAVQNALNDSVGSDTVTLSIGVGDMSVGQVVDSLGESLGATGEKAREIGSTVVEMLATIEREGTPEAITDLEKFLYSTAEAAGYQGDEIRKVTASMGEYFDQAREAAAIAQANRETLNGTGVDPSKEVEDYTKAIEGMINTLTTQEKSLKEGERAAALYSAALSTAGGDVENLDPEIKRLINSIYDEKDAQDAAAQTKKDAAKANAELRRELAEEVAAREEATRAAKKWSQFQNTLSADGNPAEAARQQYEARLDVIREHYQLVNAEQAASTEEGILALEKYEQKLEQIREKSEGGFFDDLGNSAEAWGQQATGAAASVVLGFQDADDAAASLVQTVGTQLLGAIIQWGAESIIAAAKSALAVSTSEATKTTAITGAMATQTTAAVASSQTVAASQVAAGAEITAAMAPAAAASSVASYGTAAIVGGAIAIGVIGAIIGALVAGGRSQGGDVKGGSMYRINEWDQEYFIPHTNGRMVNPAQLAAQNNRAGGVGGGSGVTVVQNFNGLGGSDFSRPQSRRRLEASSYRGARRAFQRIS